MPNDMTDYFISVSGKDGVPHKKLTSGFCVKINGFDELDFFIDPQSFEITEKRTGRKIFDNLDPGYAQLLIEHVEKKLNKIGREKVLKKISEYPDVESLPVLNGEDKDANKN